MPDDCKSPAEALELRLQLDLAKTALAKWQEWAKMHGHLEHASGIVEETHRILSSNKKCPSVDANE